MTPFVIKLRAYPLRMHIEEELKYYFPRCEVGVHQTKVTGQRAFAIDLNHLDVPGRVHRMILTGSRAEIEAALVVLPQTHPEVIEKMNLAQHVALDELADWARDWLEIRLPSDALIDIVADVDHLIISVDTGSVARTIDVHPPYESAQHALTDLIARLVDASQEILRKRGQMRP